MFIQITTKAQQPQFTQNPKSKKTEKQTLANKRKIIQDYKTKLTYILLKHGNTLR
jgi:hypothetical protein